MEWAFTGRTKDASGKLSDVMPGGQASGQPQSPATTTTAPGSTYNIYVGGKKQEGDTTDFLDNYMSQLMGGSNKKVQSPINVQSMLSSAFNSAPTYE
jgi:hypothetical protein